MSKYTENFPNLSTYDFDTIMCQLKQVCGADPGGLINAQFLSRPTTAKDIALLLHITYELFQSQVELQKQFVELYTFVKDFFENLDLQEEVNEWFNNALENNKLKDYFSQFITHDESNSITMNMLTQEVKEAMTGGSVPVVGENSVDTNNLKDRSVSMFKLKEFIQNYSLKTTEILKGYYQDSSKSIILSDSSINRLLVIPVSYGEDYTIFRKLLNEQYDIIEIDQYPVNNSQCRKVYALAINGYNGYYYSPTTENTKYLVINYHFLNSANTENEIYDSLYIVSGIYDFNGYIFGNSCDDYKILKPADYNISLVDVDKSSNIGWGEGVLGCGDNFKFPFPLSIPNLPNNPANFKKSLEDITAGDFYDLFDELPGFEKTLLGYATNEGTPTTPDNNYPIYAYSWKSTAGNLKNSFSFKPKTLLLTSGVHGDEKGAVYSMYIFAKLLTNNMNNSIIREIYSNFDITIVPLVNPYGVTMNTQNNKRNVNINRNFSYNWDSQTDPEKGESALSELESQALNNLITQEKFDYIVDYHETSISNGTYVATENKDLAWLHVKNIRKLYTNSYYRWGIFPANSEHGVAELNTISSLSNQMYALYDNNNGLIFEQSWGVENSKWTSKYICQGIEFFVNLLLSYARKFTKEY